MAGGAPRAAQRGLVMVMQHHSRWLAASQPQAGAVRTAAISSSSGWHQRQTLDSAASPPPRLSLLQQQRQQQQHVHLHAARLHGGTTASSPWTWRGKHQQPWATATANGGKVAGAPPTPTLYAPHVRRRAPLSAAAAAASIIGQQRRPMWGLASLMPGSGSEEGPSIGGAEDEAVSSPAGGRAYRERRLVGYPPQQLFSVIADVARYREFVPWCRASRVIREEADGRMVEAELEVGFQALSERYVSHVRLQRPGDPAALVASGAGGGGGGGGTPPAQAPPTAVVEATTSRSMLFEHLASTWTLRPGPQPGTTWLAFAVEFGFASPAHRHVANLFFDQVVRRMVAAFEGRCAALYGASALEQRRGGAVGRGRAGGGGRVVATTHGAPPAAVAAGGGRGQRPAAVGGNDAAALGPLPSAPAGGAAAGDTRSPLPPLDHGEDPCGRRRGNGGWE